LLAVSGQIRVRPSLGTCVVIADSHVLTCAHLWEDASQADAEVALYGGRVLHATLLAKDHDRDLAVLKLAEPAAGIALSRCSVKPGGKVWAVGSSLGWPLKVYSGHFLSWEFTDLETYQQIAATVYTVSGHSGGPLVNEQGELLGICSSRPRHTTTHGHYVPPRAIHAFLCDRGLRRLIPDCPT